MDINALQLAARFALPPNSLGYCGKDSAPEKFKKCFLNGECDGVADELTRFIVLHPYLKTIAQITGKEKFDYKVVEAYWIGNSLLDEVKLEDYQILLGQFVEQGVPDFFVEELRHKKPKRFIPNHLFQVLHVGVGKASGAVPFNIKNVNNCMVRWGKVVELTDNNGILQLTSIAMSESGYYSLSLTEEFSCINSIVPNITKGDTVAYHWGQVVKSLTDDEVSSLEYWTEKTLEAVN